MKSIQCGFILSQHVQRKPEYVSTSSNTPIMPLEKSVCSPSHCGGKLGNYMQKMQTQRDMCSFKPSDIWKSDSPKDMPWTLFPLARIQM